MSKVYFVLDPRPVRTDLGLMSYGPFDNLDDAVATANVIKFKGEVRVVASDGEVVNRVGSPPPTGDVVKAETIVHPEPQVEDKNDG